MLIIWDCQIVLDIIMYKSLFISFLFPNLALAADSFFEEKYLSTMTEVRYLSNQHCTSIICNQEGEPVIVPRVEIKEEKNVMPFFVLMEEGKVYPKTKRPRNCRDLKEMYGVSLDKCRN